MDMIMCRNKDLFLSRKLNYRISNKNDVNFFFLFYKIFIKKITDIW